MKIADIVDDIVSIGGSIARAVVPAVDPVMSLIEAGQKTLELIDKIQDMGEIPSADIAKLNEARLELEAKVNTHADSTIGRLRTP